MKALGFRHHGDMSVMEILEVPTPKPKSGEALVKLHASALNHLDLWVRQGWHGLELKLPHISGSDGAGEVVEVGEGVDSFATGDRVAIDPGINLYEDEFTDRGEHSVSPGYKILGEQLPGTHAEYISVPVKNLLEVPEHVSFEVAAAAGLVSLTTWRMLITRAQLQPAETVLIHGAGGGVNSTAIQLAKSVGCRVFATTSTDEKVAHALDIGADAVVNYKTDPRWPMTLFKLSQKQGFDVVVDNIGRATLTESIRLVKRGGRIVIVGNTTGPYVDLDIRYLFSKQISLIGSTMGGPHDYRTAMQMVFDEKLIPLINEVLPLDEGINALRKLEQGKQFGKIVLSR